VHAIIQPELPSQRPDLMRRITAAYLRDESEHIAELLQQAPVAGPEVQAEAVNLVERTRLRATDPAMVEAFMREYDLSSEEGVLLMCVAEALLRIPDQATADKLIRDKLGEADWDAHVGQSTSLLVNASTWGLMLTGRLVNLAGETQRNGMGSFKRLIGRMGEPAIRLAVRQAMRIMGHQFVMGRSIEEALQRSRSGDNANYRYSFDTPIVICRPTATQSKPSAPAGRISTYSPHPRFRSSCRPCTRVMSSTNVPGSWLN
jgi:RHH-type transcriptional regulator, proline utilization regulon repressor / proline dehydrogenase / delta 1-pyrroline-5-carboxylate dehydrogenase